MGGKTNKVVKKEISGKCWNWSWAANVNDTASCKLTLASAHKVAQKEKKHKLQISLKKADKESGAVLKRSFSRRK